MSDNLAGSRLLTLARRAPRLPHPALAVTLAVVFDVVPIALFIAIDAADVLPAVLLPAARAQTALLNADYGLYVIQVWAWVARWERRPLSRSAGGDSPSVARHGRHRRVRHGARTLGRIGVG